jgi:hypothetical protein
MLCMIDRDGSSIQADGLRRAGVHLKIRFNTPLLKVQVALKDAPTATWAKVYRMNHLPGVKNFLRVNL